MASQGVLRHGYGFWDDIFGDDSLELSDGLGEYHPALSLKLPLLSSQSL